MKNLNKRVSAAVKHFWTTRSSQDLKQGRKSGQRDSGNRTAATGGKQLDGFVDLVAKLLIEAGVGKSAIYRTGRAEVTIPGFFRPTKQWDLLVVHGGGLLCAVEFKSLCGPSFGNNYNNRVEEALGSSTDMWTAYREKVFPQSPRPVLGYLFVLEDAPGSTRSVAVSEKHFPVLDEFRDASYEQRCVESLSRLLRERCYDATCLILSARDTGRKGVFREPSKELAFQQFSRDLCGHVAASYSSMSEAGK